jgi:hypothetical protein
VSWPLGIYEAVKIIFWLTKGKEVIELKQGVMTIYKLHLLGSSPESFSLERISAFEVNPKASIYSPFTNESLVYHLYKHSEGLSSGFTKATFLNSGAVFCRCGVRKVFFGMDIDKREGSYIAHMLNEKKCLFI